MNQIVDDEEDEEFIKNVKETHFYKLISVVSLLRLENLKRTDKGKVAGPIYIRE